MCTIIYVNEADSTNSALAQSADKLGHGTVLAAHRQTAGRGQRGNNWESEPCKNLTFSILLQPYAILASHQFELSQSVAISIVKVLRSKLNTDEILIKWPNDIYYRDDKICGILIENTLCGNKIERSIVGIGLNVNQQTFYSDAPNPISMCNIAHQEFELYPLLEEITTQIISDFDAYEEKPNPTGLAAKYRFMLWRGNGNWPYRDNLTGEVFKARIAAIAPTGHMTLAINDGSFRTYAFKEISAILQ